MGIPTKAATHHSQSTITTPDIGLATTLTTAGHAAELEDQQGRVYFVFTGDAGKLRDLEAGYWNGTLQFSARNLLANHRMLKNRLYEMKGSRR